MPQQTIGIGSAPNDGTGDTLRNAFDKCNDNFTELYDGKQPLDSDLTAIAALTTTAFGRAFLALADEAAFKAAVNLEAGTDFLSPAAIAAAYQPLDASLTEHASVNYVYDTSFPGSPSSGDFCYRTDRNIEYFYDGTRWLSTDLFVVGQSSSISATGAVNLAIPFVDTYDIYLELATIVSQLTSGTTSANYFSGQFRSIDGSASATNIGSAQSMQNDTQNNLVRRTQAINAVVDMTSSMKRVNSLYTMSGTATANVETSISYRLVG